MLKRRSNQTLLAIIGLGISFALAMHVYAQSAADCAALAERAARNTTGVVGGAAVGASSEATRVEALGKVPESELPSAERPARSEGTTPTNVPTTTAWPVDISE
jgi:hypothetical protein